MRRSGGALQNTMRIVPTRYKGDERVGLENWERENRRETKLANQSNNGERTILNLQLNTAHYKEQYQ